MSECIYDNDPADQHVQKRTVDIYESSDMCEDHRTATPSAVHQQPGGTFSRVVTVCLVLLCALLLAGVIGAGLQCKKCRINPQTHNKSWAEERTQTLAELNHFCKDGCTSFNNSFYYISAERRSWEDSRGDCVGRGSDLVVVNSKAEQVFINSLKRVFWIGLTDRQEEGTWKWVDGSVLNSTGFWRKGEPTGRFRGVMEHCVDTFWYNEQNSWNDDYCAKLQLWICEKVTDF